MDAVVMSEWKKIICPSCEEVVGVYVWGKFKIVCPKCGHPIQIRTRLKKHMEETDET
jgi:ribosomal protein S27E